MADVSLIISSNANQVAKEIKGLGNSVLGAAAQAKQLKSAMDFLDSAFNKGKIDGQQYSAAIQALDKQEDRLYRSIGKANTAVKAQNTVMKASTVSTARATKGMSQAAVAAQVLANKQRMSGKSTNKFGMISQQVGYQVGDFAVQVQSGTNALVAFGQQGTQLAGLIPGLAGAILGIGLAIGTALGKVALESKGLTIDFKAVKKSFVDALEPIKPLLNSIGSAFSSLGNVVKKVGELIANNIARLISYAIAFAAIIGVKLVAAFILSGKAATMFFRLIKVGLISTGIGAFVVALGEILYRMQLMITNAGSLGLAWAAIRDVFAALWEYGTSAVDIYIARLKTVGPIVRAFIYGTINSILYGIDTAINYAIKNINKMLEKVNLPQITPIKLTGLVDDKLKQAVKDLEIMEAAVESLKGKADVALQGLLESAKRVLELAKETGTTLDTSDWLTADTDDEDSNLSGILKEQKQRGILAKLYGKEYDLKKQIFEITNELDDEADSVGAKRIAALAKINLKLEEQERLQQRNKDIADTVGSSFESAMMAMVEGTKSVKDAFREMARDIIRHLYKVLVVQQMINAIGGMMSGSSNASIAKIGGALESYDNGGYTGNGPRSGGLDGKGGFMAMMHPRETVVDHTKANSGGTGQNVVINQSFNFQANGDDSVKKIIAQAAPQIAQMTKKSMLDDRRRGGTTKAVFG